MAKPLQRYSRYARNFLLLFATQAELTTTVTMLGAPLPARMLLAIHSLRVLAIGSLFLAAVIQLAIRTQPARKSLETVNKEVQKARDLNTMKRRSRAKNAVANTLLMGIKFSIPVLMLTAGIAQWPLINVLVGFVVILSAATLLMPWIVQGLVSHSDAASEARAAVFGTEKASQVQQALQRKWQTTLLTEYLWLTVVVGVGALGLLLIHELSGVALFSTHAVFASAILLLTAEVLRRSLSADTAPILWGASSTAALGVLLTAWGLHGHLTFQALHGALPMMGVAMVLASVLVLGRFYAPKLLQPKPSPSASEKQLDASSVHHAASPRPALAASLQGAPVCREKVGDEDTVSSAPLEGVLEDHRSESAAVDEAEDASPPNASSNSTDDGVTDDGVEGDEEDGEGQDSMHRFKE